MNRDDLNYMSLKQETNSKSKEGKRTHLIIEIDDINIKKLQIVKKVLDNLKIPYKVITKDKRDIENKLLKEVKASILNEIKRDVLTDPIFLGILNKKLILSKFRKK